MANVIEEVPYADADPQTRDIYDRIMTLTGVGSPALIYRHFAVFPGFMEWIWHIVGPELENGFLVEEAPARARTVPVAKLSALSKQDLYSLGIDDNAFGTLNAILGTYNRMNPVNLALITAVMTVLRGETSSGHATSLPAPRAVPPATTLKLPPPVTLSDMDDALRETVLKLSASIPSPDETVIPTLYRHFAIWPRLMLKIAPDLQSVIDNGELEARMAEISDTIVPLADGVMARAQGRGTSSAPLEDPLHMARTCERFMFVIPQLIAIGLAIEEAFPD